MRSVAYCGACSQSVQGSRAGETGACAFPVPGGSRLLPSPGIPRLGAGAEGAACVPPLQRKSLEAPPRLSSLLALAGLFPPSAPSPKAPPNPSLVAAGGPKLPFQAPSSARSGSRRFQCLSLAGDVLDKWRDPSPASKVKVRLKAASSSGGAASLDVPAPGNNAEVCSHRQQHSLPPPAPGKEPGLLAPKRATRRAPSGLF